jgi:hypothetical protein
MEGDMTGDHGATSPRQEDQPAKELTGTSRSILSLLIFVHLFCVVVVLFGNHYGSELQFRLIRFMGPYTRLLYFDPQVIAGFHLSHSEEVEDDHFLEVQTVDGATLGKFPDPEGHGTGLRGGFRYQRWLALMRRMAMNTDNDEYLAEFSRAVGANQLDVDENKRLVLRLVRRMPLDLSGRTEAEEGGPNAYVPVYSADVWKDDQGVIRVHKRVQASEAAPVDDDS